ncbi:MAG: PP2C family protein-serine/threonine phosphatase [Streptosporangiaceae bacterium]
MFTLPSGHLCAVIGDVAGAGLPAAVIMGRMRSTLRAYAMQTADPAEILARLDTKMQHFEPGALATVLCAVFDRGLDRVCMSAAGHLPPVLARPGQPAVIADLPADLMIGAGDAGQRHVTALEIPPGTTLCLYTDGLVERRTDRWTTG